MIEIKNTITVNALVEATLLCVDDSILSVYIPNGYYAEKIPISDSLSGDKLIDSKGKLLREYWTSRIVVNSSGEEIEYLYVLKKKCTFEIPEVELENNKSFEISSDSFPQASYLEEHKEKEYEKLRRLIIYLRLYKNGYISIRDIFFKYSFSSFIGNFTYLPSISIADVNSYEQSKFSLNTNEISEWPKFYPKCDATFSLLNSLLTKFSDSFNQLDYAKSFKELTTVLEMALLKTNEQAKKEKLAKRVSALIGTDNFEITTIYSNMKRNYVLRSNSTHDGDDVSITKTDLVSFEKYVRRSLKKIIDICLNELSTNANITWSEAKNNIINGLKNQVNALVYSAILPQ